MSAWARTTLYRRWHSKEALVRGAIARMAEEEFRLPDMGSLEDAPSTDWPV